MHRDERALEISEDIKNVLGILNMRYPNFIRGDTIFKSMLVTNVEYTKQRLIRDFAFLSQKGYVMYRGNRGVEAQGISVNECSFALTAEGYEVANGLTSDQALE